MKNNSDFDYFKLVTLEQFLDNIIATVDYRATYIRKLF